ECIPVNVMAAETCDGLDNDCDGRTDEGLDDAFCPTGGQGLCAQGVTRCQGGVLSCLAPAPRPERCDGLDNDCDGQVDDSLPAALCDTGLPGICAQGAETCAGGQIECEPVAAPTLERCDGEDNDCDGAVDEASNRLMCPRVFPNTTAACVAGACEFSCIEGYVDADGVPGCERGCSFDPPVGIGLLPEATSVAVALDPEGAVGMLALYPDGAFFQVLGGAPLNLDVRGAANGRLLSPAPGLWVAAVARLEANGALSDGVDLFRLDGGPMPLETRRLNTQALRTGLVGFTERAGGGDGAVFMAGVVGGRDSVLHLRGSPLSLPQVPSYRQIGGLETVSQLAAAPVDGRAWTFAWDNTEDSLLVTLADGQGLGPPLVSPHLRGDATRSDAVMTPEGATLAMADRQGRLAFSRFTPEGGAFTAPIGPVLPPLDDFALVAPQDSGLWLIGRPLGSQRCQLWPLNTNLGSGAAIDLPVPACTDVAVAHGPEPQQVVILALGPGGDVSLVTGTCE
ncbi:MAG: putative metal-binding motif-containing protein, partial [Myxococcales bacterium]|nr:putative metal-binding motif-containing protein [Myxococcales bacterium]